MRVFVDRLGDLWQHVDGRDLMVEKLAAVKPHVTRSCLHEVRDQHRGVGYVDRILGIL